MKKRFQIFIAAVIILTASLTLYAHSGRTDSRGGHHKRSTGEYHYHHGMGPHQHPNGVCPYSNSKSGSTKSDSKSTLPIYLIIGGVAAGVYFVSRKNKEKS